ncbi:MAG: mannose-1-phosphate guanylyltransferase/mannose-6-phosphate isomerase [bacterium]|nr:mannose-1-phosphate guanylyltransferase/mannose-6-phosphate isomerase [bacterium]
MDEQQEIKIYPVLLAGGSGSRLWPISRQLFPKQLVSLVGADSMIQGTIKRLFPLLPPDSVYIVCGSEHYYEIKRHLKAIDIAAADHRIITEPCGRNTAPAILLATLTILQTQSDAILLILPADHVISDVVGFQERLQTAIELARRNYLVTFGIKPAYPETGYGYIEGAKQLEVGGALTIKRFVEKPDEKTAQRYLEAGNFFWNSGMFAFKASVIVEEFETFQPDLLHNMRELMAHAAAGKNISREHYERLPEISIDYAIMEKTERGVVLPSDFGWSDIGSWKSLYDFLPKDENHNVVEGDVILRDTHDCLIKGHSRLIVANGLKNLVVVETPDTVFISDLEKTQDVKSIVNELKARGRKEYQAHTTVYRPWGTYTILEERGDTRIKRIVVYPGAKLSHQMHYHRSEHWVVVQGTAKITKGDQIFFLRENESTYISKTTPHRLENPGKIPLHIIEVQLGYYLEEDDIVRFDDDFGRMETGGGGHLS